MKCIVPLARGGGYDKSVNSTPYMVSIAGKPVIGHLLDQLRPFRPEEVVFILGSEDKELMDYVKGSFDFKSRFILQRQGKGSAHALFGARESVDGEIVVLFGDTFFDADVRGLPPKGVDAVIWTSRVKDPRELGVVFLDGEYASRLIEKPDDPVSDLAMIGLYYFRDASKLFESISYLLDNNIRTKGSYHLTDAVQYMIRQGSRVLTREVSSWVDADRGDGLFCLNGLLLKTHARQFGSKRRAVVRPPVHLGKGCVVEDSVVGPNVSVAEGAVVKDAVLCDTVLCDGARVEGASLSRSVVERGAVVRGVPHNVNVGRDAHVRLNE